MNHKIKETLKFIAEWLERGFLIFAFFLLSFSIMRLFFIICLNDYINAATFEDIAEALWLGLRLSCQTSGILTAIILIASLIFKVAGKIIAIIIFIITSILYVASFPFYRQFHSNFNQMIFNAVNDDLYALFITMVDEFNLPLRFILAILLTAILYKIFRLLISIKLPKLHAAIIIILTYLIMTLTIFGGSLNWQTELNFENIGRTKDTFLNEAILDSYQAIYRAYVLQNRTLSGNGLDFTADNVKSLAAFLSEKPTDSDDLTYYLNRQAKGALIPKPKHIFIIVSESYANWILLDKYSDLHIADGLKSIINSPDSDYCPTFLPNGASTVSAVTGIVTGLADANVYLTAIPKSFESVYPTASAPQFQRLGYITNFWYAGPATWERIANFTTAQGFNNFYSQGDIDAPNVKGNVWGVDDKFLYQFIENRLDLSTPSFNVILNTSNHSPYTVDLEAEGINLNLPFDDELNRKLAHHAYADREIKNFIDIMKSKSPESLFVIIGDHADRCNIDKTPTDYERFAIPFVITGAGIFNGVLNKNSAGSQIDIVPTLIELIAPKGFTYHSIGRSLTENSHGVNYALFITRTAIGNANVFPLNPKPIDNETEIKLQDWSQLESYINAVRAVSYWLVKFGTNLK